MRTRPLTFDPPARRVFRAALLRWFAGHRRFLPWRKTRDPYRIWISEIMLQQTRVGVVRERYAQFLRCFPDVKTLASARAEDVLAAWSGLGYYRRAAALHRAARIIVRDHHGKLPSSDAALRALPGIGRYTAAAIGSIAFHQPAAVVDGNVERVVRRLFAWPNESLPRIWNAAQELLSPRAPGNFNQAMMELGATICLPVRPRCDACPVRLLCATRGPLERPPGPPRRSAETTYALATRRSRVYLVRRGDNESLMPGMWELPRVATGAPHVPEARGCGSESNRLPPDFTLRHAITVTDHIAHVVRIDPSGLRGGRWIALRDAAALPLTGLARRILRRAALI